MTSSDPTFRDLDTIIKQQQRANELQRINAFIAEIIQLMREQGASESSIQKALPGLYEFAKCGNKTKNIPDPPKSDHPSPPPTTNEKAPGLFLSQVQTQQVHWLWENRIPLGKITILDGDPGMGKSLLAIHVAACISTGHPMPDGTPGKQGSVILIAPEDGAGDTLKPRLEAAGGDPAHILLLNMVESLHTKKLKVVDRPFSLSQDLDLLEQAIKRTKAIFVVLDPLMAVLGHNIDSSRDQDIREVFTPLSQLAERTDCAILIIRHLNKGASENALYRGAGSIGIIAAARVGLLVAPDPYEEHKRILATTKNNLSRKANNLSYQIVENSSGIPYIQWLGENNYTLSTLLDGATNLSLDRQKILQVLRDANGPLGPQEVAAYTGQTYTLVRLTLSRMHVAKEIIRSSRGKYISPNHPSLLQGNTDTTATSDTSDTTATSDTIIPEAHSS